MTGNEFRRWRKQVGVTAKALAGELRLSERTVRRYELGEAEEVPPWLVYAAEYWVMVTKRESKADILSGRQAGKSGQNVRSDRQKADKMSGSESQNGHSVRSGAGTGQNVRAPRKRQPDELYEIFAARYQAFYDSPYRPQEKDWVQLARLRKALGESLTAELWAAAVGHYFASVLGTRGLADLCARYEAFKLGPLNQYGKHAGSVNGAGPAVALGMDLSRLSDKGKQTAIAAERFVSGGKNNDRR